MSSITSPQDAIPDASELRGAKDAAAASARASRAGKKCITKRGPLQGHPTTSAMEYTAAQQEFMFAMHAYRERSGRMFPTWCEALEVLVGLGYRKDSATAEPPRYTTTPWRGKGTSGQQGRRTDLERQG